MGNMSLVRVGGVCVILGVVTYIVARVILHDVGDTPYLRGVPDDPGQWLLDVNHYRTAVVTEASFKILACVLFIGFALGFYQALRQAGPLLGIAVVASLASSLFVIAQLLVVLGIAYELAPAYAAATEAIRPALEVMATTLMQIGALAEHVSDHLLQPVGWALFALAILRTSVMPRWMGWLGMVVALLRSLGLLEPASDVFRVFSPFGFVASGVLTVAMGVALLRLREPAAPDSAG